MSQKEYREAEGISRSELFKISRSPMHFKYALENPEDSLSLAFGRALHKYVLEKDDFGNDFIILPEINRRTKAGKEEYERYQMEAFNSGKELVSREDMTEIIAMYEAVMAHPMAKALLI